MKRMKQLFFVMTLVLLLGMMHTSPVLAKSSSSDDGLSLGDMEELGKYLETILGLFSNTEKPIKDAKVEAIPDQAYTGKAIRPAPKVTYDGKILKRSTDYTLTYSSNTNVGTGKCIIKGKGDYTGTKTVSFKIVKAAGSSGKTSSSSKSGSGSKSGSSQDTGKSGSSSKTTAGKFTVKLTKDELTYTGKALKPSVKVLSKGKTVPQSGYTVSYKDNKNVGKATITATGKGDYKGSSGTATFKIMPPKVTMTSAKGVEGGISIAWKKPAKADSYQIEYCTRKTFSGETTTVKADGKDTTAKLEKVTAGKKYYIRLRTCVKVGTRNWYSDWSSVKEATAK